MAANADLKNVKVYRTLTPGRYNLTEGIIPLLEEATLEEVAHFLSHGHAECPQGCDICKDGE